MNRISKTILKLAASSFLLFLVGLAYRYIFESGSSGGIVLIGFLLFLGGYLAHRFLVVQPTLHKRICVQQTTFYATQNCVDCGAFLVQFV